MWSLSLYCPRTAARQTCQELNAVRSLPPPGSSPAISGRRLLPSRAKSGPSIPRYSSRVGSTSRFPPAAWDPEAYCRNRLGLDAALGSIDRSKINIHGSSLAVGHPFAATGARIVGNLAQVLETAGSGRGLISICTAGGMGVSAIMERD